MTSTYGPGARHIPNLTTSSVRTRARLRFRTVQQQYGRNRRDPLTSDNVRVIPGAMLLFIGRTEYPLPLSLYSTGELVIPAYPYGRPDVPTT